MVKNREQKYANYAHKYVHLRYTTLIAFTMLVLQNGPAVSHTEVYDANRI